MRLLILCLAVASAAAFEITGRNALCSTVQCRAGRECVVSHGTASCQCVQSCPDRYAPVCGSDDVTYDTHCLMHRQACLTGEHIKVIHKGICKKKKVVTTQKPAVKKEDPAVCYSSQRDALLTVIGSHWQDTQATQPWHVAGMTFREGLWGRFYSCDTDKDNHLASDELLNCTSDARFSARPNQDTELTRALCVDALVDMADTNKDWRLDFEEFTTVFTPGYHPPQKKCSLEGRKYRDGEDVTVDGSHCICAVGSWVCTSPEPTKKEQKKNNDLDSLSFNYLDYSEEDDNTNTNDQNNLLSNTLDDDYLYDDEEEEFTINEDDDEDYMEDLFEDMLDKLRAHRRKKQQQQQHHHNHL